ncbi:ArnT family glycosyltransferase [Hymenobacter rubripertinctus]|uniref:Phospholipid carrier-dependent glycosyltransferase n=1 Tax=Hymenobacter rubripertinctus TaxID=2029981 RepID=A0A418R784_9BACT|nr:glycosyltransferase family 39 protein [Hymenobacter rubripertinctus]RIY13378.1 phospholipid carrier-dependent glycosyltransferase [Hymenobacter rubripertinctus]
MNRLLTRLPTWTLLLVVVLTGAYFLLTHEGLYALDDYYYARYAHQLLTGTFGLAPDPQGLLHDPLHERPMIFGPVAVLFALFGVNIISATIWPLLATLGCAGLIWALYRRREPVVAAGAMLLLGLHYFTLNLSNYLYPDNILMFWCLAGAAALLRGREPGRRADWWGLGFALLSFAALLSKETIAYYAPFYLGTLTLDAGRRRHGRFWGAALGTGTVLLAGYLGFYHYYTGDALYRIHLIEQTNEFLKEGNFLAGNRAALLARVTWQPLAFFVEAGLGLMLTLAAVAVGARPEPEAPAERPDRRFWLALGGITLLFYWVGSTSLSQYNPISLLPRMTTPLLPPLALAAGFGLRRLVARGGWPALLAGLGLLLMTGWLRSAVAVLYLLPGLGLLGLGASQWLPRWPRTLRPGTPALALATVLLLALALAVRPVYFMRKPSVSAHFAQSRVIRRHLGPPTRGTVLVDGFLIDNADFTHGFRVPPGLHYRRYFARDSIRITPDYPAWLLLNRATLSNGELTRQLIRYSPDSVLSWYPRRRLVAQDGPVELYEVFRSEK